MTINVKLSEEAKKLGLELPKYQSAGAAGFDLQACIDEPVTVYSTAAPPILNRVDNKTIVRFKTGVSVEIPEGYVGLVFDRSSLGFKHGVQLANGVGVIDSDYRGEIGVALVNLGYDPYTINPGDRVAQMVIVPIVQATLNEVNELSETARGTGGFGSTGS